LWSAQGRAAPEGAGVFVPLQVAADAGVLTFLSTTTVFGTPVDLTLSELVLECFFPADAATAAALRSAGPSACAERRAAADAGAAGVRGSPAYPAPPVSSITSTMPPRSPA
jgi:hypothetical protein